MANQDDLKEFGFEPIDQAELDEFGFEPIGDESEEPLLQEEYEAPTQLGAAARGLAQGASLGFADELTAGAKTVYDDIKNVFTGEGETPKVERDEFGRVVDPEKLLSDYRQKLEKTRGEYRESEESFPKTYKGAELGGGIATALIPGLNIAKGAKLASTVGKSALAGGATGLGYSEEEDLAGLAGDTLTGATVGGTIGAASKGLSQLAKVQAFKDLMSRAGEGMKRSAGRSSAKAFGAGKKDFLKGNKLRTEDMGIEALDKGIVSPFATTTKMLERASDIRKTGGQKMGQVMDEIDRSNLSKFMPEDVASRVEKEMAPTWRTPLNRAETRQFDDTIETIRTMGDISPEGTLRDFGEGSTLREAQKLKGLLDQAANWGKRNPDLITPKEQIARKASSMVKESIDDAVDIGSTKIHKIDLLDTLAEGRKEYGLGATTEGLLQDKLAGEINKSPVGLTDTLIAGAGYGALGPKGLLALAAKKGYDKFGQQIAATSKYATSKGLQNLPERLANAQAVAPAASIISQQKPDANESMKESRLDNYRSLINKLDKKQSPISDIYKQQLVEASEDENERGRVEYNLQQQPAFRRLMNEE